MALRRSAGYEAAMTMMQTWNRTMAVALALLLSPGIAAADTLREGAKLPELALTDQHEAPMPIDATVRRILYTRDMDGGDIVKEALATDGTAKLSAAHAVYISDISRMPGFVTSMFALPAMKKRPYRFLLDRDGKATADLPYQPGRVTVIDVDAGTVTSIRFAQSTDELF